MTSRDADRIPLSQRLLLRPEEAAAILGLGRSTIYELVRTGELPTVHIGRTTRIPARDLQSWIEQRRSVNGLGAGKSNSTHTGSSGTP